MLLETNTQYTFNFTNDVQFGDLPLEILYDIFQDGRICSELLSHTFARRFSDLTYVDEQGYDFTHPDYGMIEQKQITANGLRFAPSRMIGAGRRVSWDEVVDHIVDSNLFYLLANITSFPHVHVVLVPGLTLLDNCTSRSSCHYTYTKATKLFKDATKPKEEQPESGHCLHPGTSGD